MPADQTNPPTASGNGNSRPALQPRETMAVLRSKLRRNELLLKLAQRVASIEKLDDLLATLVEIVAAETDAERGTLFLNDPATRE